MKNCKVFSIYVTNNTVNKDSINIINEFNKSTKDILSEVRAKIFDLESIYKRYFGEKFKKDIQFKHEIYTINKGTSLQIKPEDYNLPGMSEAYYIMTPIESLFRMYRAAKESSYPLFEENIREYLGKSSINKKIIDTLRDENQRKNFFYYNNGITIICDSSEKVKANVRLLINPQIVNGCQTVNTIYEVLSSYNESEIKNYFESVYVMSKILIQKGSSNPTFYKNVVKYTNSQNSINEKAFAASKDYFLSLQEHFKEKGFLLLVKPSDKYKFSQLTPVEKNKLVSNASKYTKNTGVEISKLTDINIELDKLLQVCLAFVRDGYYAYNKKSVILKPTSEIYKDFSININNYLTIDNMIKLYVLYIKAEREKKKSEDGTTPIPFYLIGFVSFFIKNKVSKNLNHCIDYLFSMKKEDFNLIYDYFKDLTSQYKEENPLDYNKIIKSKIDKEILINQINMLNRLAPYKKGKEFTEYIANIE